MKEEVVLHKIKGLEWLQTIIRYIFRLTSSFFRFRGFEGRILPLNQATVEH
jgi:hypothetical protein